MARKLLSVIKIRQINSLLCGAACAQMILLARGKVPNSSKGVQDDLFDDIKNDTPGGHPKEERCGRRVIRWETFPDALKLTLNRKMGSDSAFKTHSDADANDSAARAVRGVNHELASAALLLDAKHWMVVYGWEDRGRRAGLSSIVVDGQRVTDLFLRDPNWDFNQRIDIEWFTGIQYEVDCGTFNRRFVMVARP